MDLDRVRADARDGGMRSVVLWASHQQTCVAKSYLEYHEQARDPNDAVEVHVLWGLTGTGKSRAVRELTMHDRVYNHPMDGDKWWPGYDGEEIIIFDDLRGNCFPFNYLLKILDRGPVRCQTKGSYRQVRGLKFFITSNAHPRDWYNILGDRIDQLLRRMTTITHYALPFGQNNLPAAIDPFQAPPVPEVEGNNTGPPVQPQLFRQNANIWDPRADPVVTHWPDYVPADARTADGVRAVGRDIMVEEHIAALESMDLEL